MFDIGWSEMLIIMVVAIIVVGPRDLPKMLRTVGKWVGKARSMGREFQRGIDDMIREAELDDIKDTVSAARTFDPKHQITKAVDPTGEVEKAFDMKDDTKSAAPATEPEAASDDAAAERPEDSGKPDAPVPEAAAVGEEREAQAKTGS